MNEDIIARIDQEIAQKRNEITALEAAKKALGGKSAALASPKGPKPAKGKERAPAGSLEKAVEAILAKKSGQTNGEIRDALKKNGYEWSTTPAYVGKRLVKMTTAKRLEMKFEKGERRYYLAK